MAQWDAGLLTDRQRRVVETHLTGPELRDDLSWGQTDTRVLRVRVAWGDVVVKAAGTGSNHIAREITAHETATAPLLEREACGRLIAADREASVLIMTWVPGQLVQGTAAEGDPDTYAQAGELLRAFHGSVSRVDDEYEARVTSTALTRLDQTHRITPALAARARALLTAYRPRPVALVPTHGDWQPRNWLINAGGVRIIDFGRYDARPAATDLCRLAVQQWALRPDLEHAFLDGYGSDPRDPELWRIELLREAVNTAVWAHQVGDQPFEQQGHRMLIAAAAQFGY